MGRRPNWLVDKAPTQAELFPDPDLAYLAGLFDGEGTISISKHGVRSRDLIVSMTSTFPEAPKWFRWRFGGWLTFQKLSAKNPRWKDAYTWGATGRVAKGFLEWIAPYLRIKQQQAVLAMEFQSTFMDTGGKPVPSDTLRHREEIASACHRLNARGGEDAQDGKAPGNKATSH